MLILNKIKVLSKEQKVFKGLWKNTRTSLQAISYLNPWFVLNQRFNITTPYLSFIFLIILITNLIWI